jgi:type I restriction enzyme S subunit
MRGFGDIIESFNMGVWRETWLPLPPAAEQNRIVAFVDRETQRIDAMVEKVRRSIELLKEYRTALISAAVTGKIDVRGAA